MAQLVLCSSQNSAVFFLTARCHLMGILVFELRHLLLDRCKTTMHPSLRLGHDPELVPFMWSLGAPNVSLHRLLQSGSPGSKAGQPGRLVYPENSMGHSTDSCCLIIYSTSIIMVSIYGILMHVDVF